MKAISGYIRLTELSKLTTRNYLDTKLLFQSSPILIMKYRSSTRIPSLVLCAKEIITCCVVRRKCLTVNPLGNCFREFSPLFVRYRLTIIRSCHKLIVRCPSATQFHYKIIGAFQQTIAECRFNSDSVEPNNRISHFNCVAGNSKVESRKKWRISADIGETRKSVQK